MTLYVVGVTTMCAHAVGAGDQLAPRLLPGAAVVESAVARHALR